MRRIGIIPATIVVAVWLFIIGFMFGYVGELEAGALPASESAMSAGLLSGAAALAIAAATYVAVRLVRAAAVGRRTHGPKHAG
ncbi:hypothetical protein ACWKWP_01405 [Agromyces soli]